VPFYRNILYSGKRKTARLFRRGFSFGRQGECDIINKMDSKEKIKLEIDPHNRLIYKKETKESKVPYFRYVLDGKFKIDKKNRISFHVKKSPLSSIPQNIKLKGRWSLDKNHNLILTLNKWGNQIAGNKLVIQTQLLDAKANRLIFSAASKDSEGNYRIYILKLEGRWQADKYNRLSFRAKREKGKTDILTLKGSWEVNKKNEIVYTYEKTRLVRKRKLTRTLTFKGRWDIAGKHRIIYCLNKKINSQFDFEVNLGKAAKKGLKYKVGIGAVPRKKEITLLGEWKVNKNLGLIFEMPFESGRYRGLVFGADCRLDDKHKLEFKLKNKKDENLDISIKLSRKIMGDSGEAFLEELIEGGKISIVAGLGFRW